MNTEEAVAGLVCDQCQVSGLCVSAYKYAHLSSHSMSTGRDACKETGTLDTSLDTQALCMLPVTLLQCTLHSDQQLATQTHLLTPA